MLSPDGLPLPKLFDIGIAVADALAHRPREGHRPPRPQGCQRDGHRVRAREGARLRAGQARDGRAARRARRHPIPGTDPRGRRDGDTPLHVSRAASGTARRSPQRHLLVRCSPLRDRQRPAPIRRRDPRGPHLRDPHGRAGTPHRLQARPAAAPRADRRAVPGERGERSVPVGAGGAQRAARATPRGRDGKLHTGQTPRRPSRRPTRLHRSRCWRSRT